ncbi:XdhC family protein [Flagellimonas sp. HMM57]|uniref:XdhC family protein n=1 Tax=unclassified Flagellimonas TaxID=2644544 RepID=UPI0013D44252|nr:MULTISPECIES: XdhC/CoxI family protein [unclassified Flagellimonas]UII75863.1 XdhC family protein [Flagellimonas sp. HMM57]
MTHELKNIIQQYEEGRPNSQKAILATVVSLEGSSYRRPGVRMLIFENGDMVGAVSGGCVEKEILRQAQSVFTNGVPKVMVYDGRYRLGCEGILYILLEVFDPSPDLITQFWSTILQRNTFEIQSFYEKEHTAHEDFGTFFRLGAVAYPINQSVQKQDIDLLYFEQKMQPCFQLMIIGAEHDAVQLCKYAALTGWEVTIVANPREEKTENDFPGIHKLITVEPESFRPKLDEQTAVAIMTHSFVKDLQYLVALKDQKPAYMGLLGPFKRREKLFDELLERHPDISENFLDQIHGPAGIDIGAETPQEIAIAVLAEILTVVRHKEPMLLKNKMGKIHN